MAKTHVEPQEIENKIKELKISLLKQLGKRKEIKKQIARLLTSKLQTQKKTEKINTNEKQK